MLFRFSLYGFLKNQRYFEAFLILAFLEKGLDFFQIGLLIACRELTVNLFEVPSGALADVYGRRRTMIAAFSSYLVSFLLFGLADRLGALLVAMVCYGIGDAFRTGTHKSMIFTWLRLNDRADERVRVYGYTRSWSKFGSAVSVIVAAVIVLASDRYTFTFFLAMVPYGLCILNFLAYPKELDGRRASPPSPLEVARHMVRSLRDAMSRRPLRRLVFESMGFDGVFMAAKDYLQPVLAATAISAAAGHLMISDWSEIQRTALLVGPVYFVLFLLAGASSRHAHRISTLAGGEGAAAGILWLANVVVFAVLTLAGVFDWLVVMIVAFVLTHALHNFWRPVLISRFDAHGTEEQGASLLSIESQAQRGATMVLAPLLGLAVDRVAATGAGGDYWPVGAVGLLASVVFLATAWRATRATASGDLPAEGGSSRPQP